MFGVRAKGRMTVARALSLACFCSCGARTAPLLDEVHVVIDPNDAAGAASKPMTCGTAPQCVTRDAANPCGPARLVPPVCDDSTLTWQCPAGAWLYQRVEPASDCLPLSAGAQIGSVSGSLSRVPTDDGRCLWIAEEVRSSSGDLLRNVALVADEHPTFGACPRAMQFLSGSARPSVAFSDNSSDPSLQVQITGGFLLAGQARVTYRMFRVDPNAVFGVTELGTGIGFWDSARQLLVVFPQPRFDTQLSLGNASYVAGSYAFLWGCNAPGHYLTEGCLLGRIDRNELLELYLGNNRWSDGASASNAAIVFDDGPWISSVLPDPRDGDQLLHVFASGFSEHLQLQLAQAPIGPWGQATGLASCKLPGADSKAYCAGPIVHEELLDPARPGELVVSYGVATTDPQRMDRPSEYWSRLDWITR